MRDRFIQVAAAICAIVSLMLAERPAPRPPSQTTIRAVVLGDSVAHGAGDESGTGIAGRLDGEMRARGIRFAPTVNRGINGARTYNVLRLMQDNRVRPLLEAANVVIVSIGGNDLYGDSMARLTTLAWPQFAIERVQSRVRTVVQRIERINPSARVILLGLYNPYRRMTALDAEVSRWDSRLIATFAADRAVTVERIADLLQSAGRFSSIDHFHPSAAGYALIAARIAPALAR